MGWVSEEQHRPSQWETQGRGKMERSCCQRRGWRVPFQGRQRPRSRLRKERMWPGEKSPASHLSLSFLWQSLCRPQRRRPAALPSLLTAPSESAGNAFMQLSWTHQALPFSGKPWEKRAESTQKTALPLWRSSYLLPLLRDDTCEPSHHLRSTILPS